MTGVLFHIIQYNTPVKVKAKVFVLIRVLVLGGCMFSGCISGNDGHAGAEMLINRLHVSYACPLPSPLFPPLVLTSIQLINVTHLM